MRPFIIVMLMSALTQGIFAQEAQNPKFYLGFSYGTSYSLGNFADTDITNPDAGFAENGRKIDVFAGFFLNEKTTLTGIFRNQSFNTEIEDIIEMFNTENPGTEFTGSTEDWETNYFLVGLAYRVDIGRKFNFSPRIGFGPLFVTSPDITVDSPNTAIARNFQRNSETGVGLGYEIGVGFRTDLGKRISLLPTFTFSGGVVAINDVTTVTNNTSIIRDYRPEIRSFNLGISVGYRFY